MSHHDDSTSIRNSNEDKSLLVLRMIGVQNGSRERIAKGGSRLVERDAMLVKNPFRKTEKGIIEHMNEDHSQALFHYSKVLAGVEADALTMTGIDSEGFDMLADRRKVRIDFDSPIYTVEEARANLIRLARM